MKTRLSMRWPNVLAVAVLLCSCQNKTIPHQVTPLEWAQSVNLPPYDIAWRPDDPTRVAFFMNVKEKIEDTTTFAQVVLTRFAERFTEATNGRYPIFWFDILGTQGYGPHLRFKFTGPRTFEWVAD